MSIISSFIYLSRTSLYIFWAKLWKKQKKNIKFSNHMPKSKKPFSAQILSNAFHVLRNLMRSQLPFESNTVQKLKILFLLQFGVSRSLNVPSTVWNRFYLFAFYTLKLRIRVLFRIEICALWMYPSCTFFTHNPLFTVISLVKINLLAINTKGVLYELLLTAQT